MAETPRVNPTLFDALEAEERAQAREGSDRAKREAGLRAGIEARDNALVQGERHADPDWKKAAEIAIRKTAEELNEFIVDHVFERMNWSDAYGKTGIKTTDQRAMGALILAAARQKLIARTDRFLPSFNRAHHACPRRVWRSLVYRRK